MPVTCTKPSAAICWEEMAPEFPQPTAAVLVSELPEIEAPTASVQITGCPTTIGANVALATCAWSIVSVHVAPDPAQSPVHPVRTNPGLAIVLRMTTDPSS